MSPTSHGAQARLWLIFLQKEDMTRDLKASPPAWGRSSWAERRKGVVGDGDGGGGAQLWPWGEGRRHAVLDRRARRGRSPPEGSQPSAVMRLGALPLPGLFLLHQGWPREGSRSWGPAPCVWPNLSPTAEVNILPVHLLSLCSENVRPPLSL